MLSESKFGKYLIYAVGEIVLVVIGILIALSINNWNDNRKLKDQEKILLKEFKRSVEGDLITLPKWQAFSEATPSSINVILKSFENNLSYQDSLKYHFGNTSMPWDPSISLVLFESLNSTELSLISNVDLRKKIISYYRKGENLIRYKNKYNAIIENASKDIFSSRFNSLWDSITESSQIPMIPNDYEALKNDQQYHYFLKSLRNQFDLYIARQIEYSIGRAENLLKLIENELLE